MKTEITDKDLKRLHDINVRKLRQCQADGITKAEAIKKFTKVFIQNNW